MSDKDFKQEMLTAREEYINIMRNELLGPGSEFSIPDREHELIAGSPIQRYSVGILFPQGVNFDYKDEEIADEIDTESVDKEIVDSQENENFNKQKNNRDFEQGEITEQNLDDEINMSTQYKPSSMGFTFLVQGEVNCLRGKLCFATYKKADVKDCIVPYSPENPEKYYIPSSLAQIITFDRDNNLLRLNSPVTFQQIKNIFENYFIPENEFYPLKKRIYRLAAYCVRGYVREPHEVPEFLIDFSNNNYAECKIEGTNAKIVGFRKQLSKNLWFVTVMLVNDKKATTEKATDCIFQPQIAISTINNTFVFKENNPNMNVEMMEEEEKSLNLLYRNKKIYGTGLGTSVNWQIDTAGNGSVWSEFLPQIEVPSMDFSLPENGILKDDELSMKYLSDLDGTDKNEKLLSLRKLVDLYKIWINNLEKSAAILDKSYQSAAAKNISECKRACERMYAGIETLQNNENAYMAFTLANRAMFMQRIHLAMQSKMASDNADRYPEDEEIAEWLQNVDYRTEDDANCMWRPFQIAFLLMDINSIVNDNSPERSLADLIWFPTGGGKTEAYLGLTAFAIFYRKIQYPKESSGTAIIMRYTLRLLAAQQFTRAATLICACEVIRIDSTSKRPKYFSYLLGKDPITIGLWIGGNHIPNKNVGKESVKEHLDKLFEVSNSSQLKYAKEKHNKFQVLKCPWCGTKMVKDVKDNKIVGEWGYKMDSKHHFYMHCPHEECNFNRRLPIQIIDEELYQEPPTLLFGTVDKFAMLPWKGETGNFFGVGSKNRAPELIIQDELHLISGALGTIVGLYETAIDGLCGLKGVYPKIIASTATIRKAKEQCSVLYNREVVQFPAPGLDAEDSFFAKEKYLDYDNGAYGRIYVGVMPSGKSKAMTENRIISGLMQKIFTMELPEKIKDKLWTLTVYFNSLKDLGKTSTLVGDDVRDFIIRLANRMFGKQARSIGRAAELTSRVSTTELNETLDKLEKIEYSQDNIAAKRYASNILLATNMISVGIDIARLNVMLMVGQPKLTSEYIQASSRVGRSFPGVVFVQYDSTKNRDRSHYERFRAYHESLYRFVEPTGATPFSRPARERALHAVLVTLLREMSSMKKDADAINFDYEYFFETIEAIKDFIIKRVDGINKRCEGNAQENLNKICGEIDEFFKWWQAYVKECNSITPPIPLYFGNRFMFTPPSEGCRRLMKGYNSEGKDNAVETLTSMRNVDTMINGSIVIWEK